MGKKSSRPDFLSDLPLGIIRIILSLVPIKDAVRTSILSKQWRFTWHSLPRLKFNDTCVKNYSEEKRLFDFINQALLLHKGSINEFQLHLVLKNTSAVQCQYINQWLLFLSRNDIRTLNLQFRKCDPSLTLHSSLYSCQYLTFLKLLGPKIPLPPPSFKGFMFLKTLIIGSINALRSTIESIIAHSPLLEELMIVDSGGSELKIHAPNLKLLKLWDKCDHLILCTPLLEELVISVGVKSIAVEPFQTSFSFPHLRAARLLSLLHHHYVERTTSFIRLITSSPNLHKLEMTGFRYDASKVDGKSIWESEYATDITYDSLKLIKIENSFGLIDEMKLIEFLLARSPVLEKMIYKRDEALSDKEYVQLMAELLRFRRASANAEIVLEDKLFSIPAPEL